MEHYPPYERFDRFFVSIRPSLLLIATRLESAGKEEDLVQATYERIRERKEPEELNAILDSDNGRARMRGYCTVVMRRIAADDRRTEGRINVEGQDRILDEIEAPEPEDEDCPPVEERRFNAALAEQSELSVRIALLLHSDWEFADIARRFNISVSAAKSRYHRLISRLRDRLT